MKTRKIKLSELKQADYNPRKIERTVLDKIKNSIKEFGYVSPLVINQRNNIIIGGNQRFAALVELYGPDAEVEVVCLDLDEPKEKALNIALNKISAEWEYEKLGILLNELNNLQMSDLTGFDKNELHILDIGVEMPEIKIRPSSKVITYPLTFHFEDVNDKIAVEEYFKKKDGELDCKKLKKLIK